MLELRHLRSLIAISGSDKLVVAAEQVNLSQSALAPRGGRLSTTS